MVSLAKLLRIRQGIGKNIKHRARKISVAYSDTMPNIKDEYIRQFFFQANFRTFSCYLGCLKSSNCIDEKSRRTNAMRIFTNFFYKF